MKPTVRVVMLWLAIGAVALVLGNYCGGPRGMRMAFGIAIVGIVAIYFLGDQLMMAIHRAQSACSEEFPDLFETLHELSEKTGLPVPKVYLIPSATANAMALGRSPHCGVIALTQGLLNTLGREELQGVLAHGLVHIQNHSPLIWTPVAVLAEGLTMIVIIIRWIFLIGSGGRRQEHESNPFVLLVMAVVYPVMAILIHLTVSRRGEKEIDRKASALCGNPLYLASALHQMEKSSTRIPLFNAHPAAAHLFTVSPLSGRGFDKLFRVHPSPESRMAALEQLARRQGL